MHQAEAFKVVLPPYSLEPLREGTIYDLADVGFSGDFDGDGKADLLWRNEQDGTPLAFWKLDGTTLVAGTGLNSTVPQAGWHIAGLADFNGDHKSDILWRNDSGTLALWEMDGPLITNAATSGIASAPDASWHIAGLGDFYGDGNTDILWHNDSGELTIWRMNGNQIVGWDDIRCAPDASWSLVGVADLDGDGKSDMIWRNDHYLLQAIWIMDGTAVITPYAASCPYNHIIAVADFDGDAKADVLYEFNGLLFFQQMDGGNIGNSHVFHEAFDVSWTLGGVGDTNGDGRADLIWRLPDGTARIWESGSQVVDLVATGDVGAPGLDWKIAAAHYDFA
jgi:serralysin